MYRLYSLLFAAPLLSGCARTSQPAADPGLLAEIRQIRAIDNHSHPVRVTSAGEPPDRGFDALPVNNMEPQSDPVNLRPHAPAIAAAARALYGSPGEKQRIQREQGDNHPAWVLDQMGVHVMLAPIAWRWERASSRHVFAGCPTPTPCFFRSISQRWRSRTLIEGPSSRWKTGCGSATSKTRAWKSRRPRSPSTWPTW
jgi:hypothetical protein